MSRGTTVPGVSGWISLLLSLCHYFLYISCIIIPTSIRNSGIGTIYYARGVIIPTSIRNSGIGTIYYARGHNFTP